MKKLLLLLFIFIIAAGCSHGDKRKSFREISDEFIGTWSQTEDCKVHESMRGDLIIRKSSKRPGEIEKQWVNRAFTSLNGIGKSEYLDFSKNSYEIRTDVETYNQGRTLVSATIWRRTEGDEKNISVIMTRYKLNKDELIYEKFGYSAYEEGNSFKISSYAEAFPNNYYCLMKRKKSI